MYELMDCLIVMLCLGMLGATLVGLCCCMMSSQISREQGLDDD